MYCHGIPITHHLLHQLQRAASRRRLRCQTRPGGSEALAEGVEFPGDHQTFGLQRVAGPKAGGGRMGMDMYGKGLAFSHQQGYIEHSFQPTGASQPLFRVSSHS